MAGRQAMLVRILSLMFAPGLWWMPFDAQKSRSDVDFVADALSWYSVWMTRQEKIAPTQVCRGERRGEFLQFRCEPLGVVVSVVVDQGNGCLITNMRAAIFDSDGLTLKHFPAPSGAQPHPSDANCGELPDHQGAFEITVTLRSREVSRELSAAARDVAIKYFRQFSSGQCRMFFPKVKAGDPFSHVYEKCGAALSVSEFPIVRGKVSDFPHWQYRRPPPAADKRCEQNELWWRIE